MLDVRALSPDEWAITRDLRLAALLDAPQAFGGTYEDSAKRDEASWRSWPSGGQVFAAWLDGQPAGMACWVPRADEPKVGDLIAMWVAPRARGTKTAAALIDAVARCAREAGNLSLELVVYKSNPAAKRAYTKNGFADLGDSAKWPEANAMRLNIGAR
jgi:GNAT superfamily N-acetyltransferase